MILNKADREHSRKIRCALKAFLWRGPWQWQVTWQIWFSVLVVMEFLRKVKAETTWVEVLKVTFFCSFYRHFNTADVSNVLHHIIKPIIKSCGRMEYHSCLKKHRRFYTTIQQSNVKTSDTQDRTEDGGGSGQAAPFSRGDFGIVQWPDMGSSNKTSARWP